jgi:hypothetical protein
MLRCYAKKLASPLLDRVEMEHVRDCVAELVTAHPPLALQARQPCLYDLQASSCSSS